MRFTCPACSKSYRLPPERLGPAGRAQISCPNCKAVVLVKATGDGEHLECQLLQGNAPQAAAPAMAQSSAQPAAEPASWYVVVGRDKVGPLVPGQIAEYLAKGELTIHSLAWHKGMAGWVKIEELPELLQLLASSKAVGAARESGLIAAQPVHPAAAPSAGHGQAQAPQSQNPRASQGIAPQPMSPRASQGLAPQPVARPAAAPSAAQPAAHSAAQPPAQRPAQPAAAPSAAPQQPRPAPAPARPTSPQQAKPNDLDDAGPTMEASIPAQLRPAPPSKAQGKAEPAKAPAGKADAAKSEARTAKSPPPQLNTADVHGDAFFNNHHDLHDIELALPDPNKHKPTKEEYQNLLQEFSVMFRLDKRSKRQKILITVIVASLILGAIGFGLSIRYQGMKKAQLLADANNILGMFNLPYQTSVTIDVAGDTPEPEAKPGEAKPAKPKEGKQEVQLSDLAAKMRTVVKAKRAAVAKAPVGPTVTEEEKKRLMAMLDSGGPGVRGATIGEGVTASDIRKMCEAQKPSLRACGQSAGVADFKIRFSVGAGGRVEGVKASADGKDDASLASCCENKLRKVHLAGASPESFSCTID